ncbi:hypothetical protein [uncultured Sphaerotilus sp.]|uniref:hypothetical protein n=1 Tax=uncultured Sphaerotilus sp. TaxID=474984 RepID=UPI0030CA15FA
MKGSTCLRRFCRLTVNFSHASGFSSRHGQSAPFAGRRVGCAVSEVLAGKRRLNLRQVQALAGRFSVPMEMLAG